MTTILNFFIIVIFFPPKIFMLASHINQQSTKAKYNGRWVKAQ
jgi:hypothetical protein